MKPLFQSFYKTKNRLLGSKSKVTWCIVGCGNPGEQYRDTRHNMGWKVLDLLRSDDSLALIRTNHALRKQFQDCTEHRFRGKTVAIGYPNSYVNLMGPHVKAMINHYQVSPRNLIVAYDDMHLDVGMVRVKRDGSSGNHNGIKSIIEALGTQDFIRVRVGIGRPNHPGEVKNYVLSTPPDMSELTEALQKAQNAIKVIMQRGVGEAMQMNRRMKSAS